MRLTMIALLCVLGAAVVPATAAAAPRSCGMETALSHGSIFAIKATHTTCKRAKEVAGGWFNVQSHGDSASNVYDSKGRRWRCRITQHATGTDPGYNPHTRIRCASKRAVVRFKLRS